MKKLVFLLAGGMFIASCNRDQNMVESPIGTSQVSVQHFEQSDLDGMITPMSQTFGFNAKGDALVQQLNYTYRGWAEPVRLDLSKSDLWPATPNGTQFVELTASAAWTHNDLVFVAWHAHQLGGKNTGVHNFNAPGPLVGGSITAYKQVGIGQYEFTDRVDFFDTDMHELYGAVNDGTGNIEVLLVGQRSQITSGYLLDEHTGAVVTRIDYDYINDEFFEGSIRELPLPGNSATDIVGAAKRFYVTTYGTGSNNSGSGPAYGGIYELDRNLTNVIKASPRNANPGYFAIAFDPQTRTPDFSQLFVMEPGDVEEFNSTWNAVSSTTTWGGTTIQTANVGFGTTLGRHDITIATSNDNPFTPTVSNDALVRGAGGRVFVSGEQSQLYVIDETTNSSSVVLINNGAGPSIGQVVSTEYDSGLDVLYCAMAGNGTGTGIGKAIKVIALEQFANNSVLIDRYDVVGEFVEPNLGNKITSWGASWPVDIEGTKEITVFGSRNIALAAGDNGVFFIQRDKLN